MLRCVPKAAVALALPLLLATAAGAQTSRPFPATALRGTLQIVQPPEVLLNGEPERLSPGARIRAANNMLQLSGTLVGQTLLVHYTREPSGLVHDVWILTPEEAARKPWPGNADQARRWEFNPAAQTWTRK
jgi:hypothetical protein